jgi:3'-phosphoadenosine 5'-phosphosulfate sulfotransferase (PAPS reductase)/FAD synthetase
MSTNELTLDLGIDTPPADPDLTAYDIVLINTSGGKDSQTMMRYVYQLAVAQGATDRLVAVHADLGRVEWDGTAELAAEQSAHYGIRFEKVARPQGDLLEQIEARGMFPSSAARYCTSDHKRAQCYKVMTRLTAELRDGWKAEGTLTPRPVRILNCMGFRAEESPARKKKPVFERDGMASTKTTRHVDRWLPIHEWSETQVWDDIRASGVRHHEAYDHGMPRLSCSFCVLASQSALVRAAQLRPVLAAEYAAVEVRIGHTFQNGRSMADIIKLAEATPEPVAVAPWNA